MKKKTIAVIAILVLASVGVAIAVTLTTPLSKSLLPLDNNPKNTDYDYTEGAAIVPGKYLEVVYNDITGDYRPIYPNMTADQYEWYFNELPAFPEDFFTISKLVYDGKITDYSRLSAEYWKQPEFYSAWFDIYENRYLNFDERRWTPEGYGCYPTIKEVATNVKNDKIVVNTYFRTGFDVNSYQGLVVKPYLPDKAVNILGNKVFDQPKNADKYLSVKILNPDDEIFTGFKNDLLSCNVGEEGWMVILKPTHLILRDKYGDKLGESGFPDDWVRIVELEITIAADTPAGDYVVALDVEPPCFDINQEYYFSTEHEYYGSLYYPSGYFFRTGRPHFQVILKIT